MKDIVKKMQRVINANSFFHIIIFGVLVGCMAIKNTNLKDNNNLYSIKKYKSDRNVVVFDVETKEYPNKKIPASISINDVYFNEQKSFLLGMGQYDVKIFFIGKKTLEIKKLVVERGDSIIVKAFLEKKTYKGH